MKNILRLGTIVWLLILAFAMDTGLYLLKKLKRIIIFPGG